MRRHRCRAAGCRRRDRRRAVVVGEICVTLCVEHLAALRAGETFRLKPHRRDMAALGTLVGGDRTEAPCA